MKVWLRRIIRPKLLGWIVITYAGVSLMILGPVEFVVSLLADEHGLKARWFIFLDKVLLSLISLGGAGLTRRKAWGRWLVISSLSAALIVPLITALSYIEEIVSSITLDGSLVVTGLVNVLFALLILVCVLAVDVPPSESATTSAVDGGQKIRLLSSLYTVHLCFALPCAMLGGIYLLEYSGTKEMLAMMLVIPLVMSLPVIAIFSLFGIGLSVKYKDKGLAIISVLAVLCLMLFGVFVAGFKVPEYALDFAGVLYIISSFAFSIRWFYVERPRLRQQMSDHNPKDINSLSKVSSGERA